MVLIDEKNKTPIAYATIKVLHRTKGAVSTKNGHFELELQKSDSLYISCLGYYDTIISNIIFDTIYLKQNVINLSQVTVVAKKFRKKYILGNGSNYLKQKLSCTYTENQTNGCYYWFSGGSAEFAEIINLPDSANRYRINSVSLPVKKIDCWKPFFIKIYTVTDNIPNNLILQDLITPSSSVSTKKGKLLIDLKEKKIFLEQMSSFAISISWSEEDNLSSCETGLLLKKDIAGISYSRSIFSTDYKWYIFHGTKKNEDVSLGLYRTMFTVFLDEFY